MESFERFIYKHPVSLLVIIALGWAGLVSALVKVVEMVII